MNTLNEWLAWQVAQYPSAIDLGLSRVQAVWQRLYPKPLIPPVITVAGSNGKGSTVAILSQICKQADIRFAAYTSPELLKYNERFNINGEDVSDELICAAFAVIKKACQSDIKLTTFEYSTLAALKIFSQQSLDLIILEVGLGGRLDAVNIIDPDIAIITGIALDHQSWLGDNREAIGYEKAGIFRTNQRAIYAGKNIPQSILKQAKKLQTDLMIRGVDYQIEINQKSWHLSASNIIDETLPLPHLKGVHQIDNAAGAIIALLFLKKRLNIDLKAIIGGLKKVQLNGRFQNLIIDKVPIILDVAHNLQSATALVDNLKNNPVSGKIWVVFSMLDDKDIQAVIEILQQNIKIEQWLIAPLQVERALSLSALKQCLPQAMCFENIAQAFLFAKKQADKQDRVVVFGSFHTVAQVL